MIKRFFKSIIVAFSLYSRIPMPRFQWASDDMKYHLCFFPWVGAVIGLAEYGWKFAAISLNIGPVLYYALALAFPLLLTGDFHMDGFMDTMDALHSYQDAAKKREILKDPHVGAFAVISLAVYMLLAVGFASQVKTIAAVRIVAISFFISRCLSGLSVTFFPKSKKEGMLYTEASAGNSKIVGISLVVQLVIGGALMLYVSLPESLAAVFALVGMLITFVYYYFMSKKQFGGISGDISGFFVVVSELAALIGVALAGVFNL